MKTIKSLKSLEEFGRIQLSEHFFMREFLYSEISNWYGIPNYPDDPTLAIEAGVKLCENVLEPIMAALGKIAIRSAYRSSTINQWGNEKGHTCAPNQSNYGRHIWDRRDEAGYLGATACIVVNSFLPYYEKTADWTALAWWVHDHIPAYSKMKFFPELAAFNVSWSENPNQPKIISSFAPNPHSGQRGYLTQSGEDNFSGDHSQSYAPYLASIR